jgi:cold shock protein
MGRYKDYREPKRRGYDDDYGSSDRPAGGRPNYPSPSAPQASAPVDAVVKWFNAEKGFGFVVLAGGSEAFLHVRQLEAAGHSSVPEGARVEVRIGQGQKGPEVTEVIEVDTSTARVTRTTERRSTLVPLRNDNPALGRPRNVSVRSNGTTSIRGLVS